MQQGEIFAAVSTNIFLPEGNRLFREEISLLIFAHYLLLLAVQLKIVRRSFDNILKTAVSKDQFEIGRENISIAFLKQIFN